MTWQEDHIAHGERMIAFAKASMRPGQVGAVPLAITTEMDEIPIEQLGERPPYLLADRHRTYEDDFNSLVALEIRQGRVSQDVGDLAMTTFHVYMTGTRTLLPTAQASPKFYQ